MPDGSQGLKIDIKIPKAHTFLLTESAPYKGMYGGRGGAKSHSFARSLIALTASRKMRVLCGREFQSSIKDSVHYLLAACISEMGLDSRFNVLKNEIQVWNGGEIFYRGFSRNLQEIKSTEALDLVWIEEAHFCTASTFEILIPTIRKKGSQLWMSWNTLDLKAPVHDMFVTNDFGPDAIIRKVGWQDNPFFPAKMNTERRRMLAKDPDAYDHVWEGHEKKITAATIFRGKYEVCTWETPTNARFMHGADWGFSQDPTVLIRCFAGPPLDQLHTYDYVQDESCLYIDYESYGVGVELNHLPDLFDHVPTARNWQIFADNARPETISLMRNYGFQIDPADKWDGCVEDGIEHLKAFDKIYIHATRCPRMFEEARLYSFKVDPKDERIILPIVVDQHNHCWDACRYALNRMIQRRGELANWAKLAKRRMQVMRFGRR